MVKITPLRVALADDRRKRAQERRDRVANKLYELMGWGTYAEIRNAERNMELANKELRLAEQHLENLQKQLKDGGESSH